MENEIKGKSILVTGGTGSIGNELVKQLLDSEAGRVIVFSRDESKQFVLRKEISDSRLVTVIGDIRNKESLDLLFNKYKFDIAYHAAAMKHVTMCDEFPGECVKTNIFGTENLINLASKHKISKLITISTDKSANPINIMGAAKFIAEKLTLNSNFTCVRFGNVANSRGSVIPIFLDNILNNRPLTVTDLKATRFMMTIPEAVGLILKATTLTNGGEIFILNMKSFLLSDLVDVFRDKIAPRFGISPYDIKVNISGLISGEKLHEQLINDNEVNRTYKLRDMYVVLKNASDAKKYSQISKADLANYSSNHVDLLSKTELESIIINYLRQISSGNLGMSNPIGKSNLVPLQLESNILTH